MPRQGLGEAVAALAVAFGEAVQARGAARVVQIVQRRPLPDAAGVQVGGLLEAIERKVEIFRRGEEAQPQAGGQHLGERALVDPGALGHEAAGRPPLAGVVDQLAIGIVLEQHHIAGPARLRQTPALGQAPATARGVLEGGGHVGQGGRRPIAKGARRHGLKLRAEEAEHLQGRQIGRGFHRHPRAGIHAELGDQVDALLRSGQHQHPLGRALQADALQLLGDADPEFRLSFGGAILQQRPGRGGQLDVLEALGRGQAAGEGDHLRTQRGLQHGAHRRSVQVVQAGGQSGHGAAPCFMSITLTYRHAKAGRASVSTWLT